MSKYVRIDVTISTRQPDLLKDMQAISEPRVRAERLRFLAQLGWLILQGHSSLTTVSADNLSADEDMKNPGAGEKGTAKTDAASAPKKALSPARRKAMAQLGQSLGASPKS